MWPPKTANQNEEIMSVVPSATSDLDMVPGFFGDCEDGCDLLCCMVDSEGDEYPNHLCYCSKTSEWNIEVGGNVPPICDRAGGCRRLISHGYDGEKLYVSDSEETCVYKNLDDPDDEPVGYWCRNCKELHINNDEHNFIENGCWTLKDPKTKQIQEVCGEIFNLVENRKKEMNDQTYIMLTEKLMNIHNR